MTEYEYDGIDITDFVEQIRMIQTIWQGCSDDLYSADFMHSVIDSSGIDVVAVLEQALRFVRVWPEADYEEDFGNEIELSELQKVMKRMNNASEGEN